MSGDDAMEDRRRTIGEILVGFGRISEADVEAALRYQEEHGGYFGEALLALDRVTPEELEWGLASQFDLPYVFPDADTIDPEAVKLVTPHWALRHLALPIVKTEHTLTVVVDSPARSDAIRELQASSGLAIELALAPAERIRELIRRVYGAGPVADDAGATDVPVPLADFLSNAIDDGATSFGVSVRDERVLGWYRGGRGDGKRRLAPGWRGALEDFLVPSASGSIEDRDRARWCGHLRWSDRRQAVEVSYLAGPSGMEFAFRPVEPRTSEQDRLHSPPPNIVSEIALLARSGAARFLVSLDPSAPAGLLPRLPSLVLDPLTRAVHLGPPPTDGTPVFTVELPEDAEARDEALEELMSYGFDALTIALSSGIQPWVARVLELAPAIFLAGAGDGAIGHEDAVSAGLGWELRVRSDEKGERTEWSITPLEP